MILDSFGMHSWKQESQSLRKVDISVILSGEGIIISKRELPEISWQLLF